MKIDVHAHLYPKPYLESVMRLTEGDTSAWTLGVRQLLTTKIIPERRMVDIDAHIEDMDKAGVDVEVLSLSGPQVYWDDEKTSVELAKITNDTIAEVCSRHPSRFKGYASLPLPHADAALKELDRSINVLGLHGVVLGANVKGAHLDDERFMPVYKEINRQKLTIFLHPMVPPGQEEMEDYDLAAAVGFMMDTTLATLRLIYRGVFEENPDLNLIFPHLGGVVPFLWDRIASSYRTRPEARLHIQKAPAEYLKRLYYDTVNFNPASWRCTIDAVGIDHLVYGSDYPLPIGSMERGIAIIDALDITPEQREQIYSGNAKRLLR